MFQQRLLELALEELPESSTDEPTRQSSFFSLSCLESFKRFNHSLFSLAPLQCVNVLTCFSSYFHFVVLSLLFFIFVYCLFCFPLLSLTISSWICAFSHLESSDATLSLFLCAIMAVNRCRELSLRNLYCLRLLFVFVSSLSLSLNQYKLTPHLTPFVFFYSLMRAL